MVQLLFGCFLTSSSPASSSAPSATAAGGAAGLKLPSEGKEKPPSAGVLAGAGAAGVGVVMAAGSVKERAGALLVPVAAQ